MRYALIGKKLGHSFSKDIHTSLGLEYDHVELREDEVVDFIKRGEYDGFNVTIPYKEIAYRTVDILDDTSREVGAVNTVIYRDGLSVGYNTDVMGMRYMLSSIGVCLEDKSVLILGSGGTSHTARALCKLDGAREVFVCSRKGDINYTNVYDVASEVEVIINCTPVGMYPNNYDKLLRLDTFEHLQAVADCIYNPLRSTLLTEAERLGISHVNGIPMLVAQAVYAEEIWLGKSISREVVDSLVNRLTRTKSNIVLIGMPGSGKSTISRLLADRLSLEVVDTDEEITKLYTDIPTIISDKGESAFRDIETDIVREIAKKNGVIISTGGGAILREQNVDALRQNGVLVLILRDISSLSKEGRPLSREVGVDKLWQMRRDIYFSVADYIVDNNGDIEDTLALMEEIHEDISY